MVSTVNAITPRSVNISPFQRATRLRWADGTNTPSTEESPLDNICLNSKAPVKQAFETFQKAIDTLPLIPPTKRDFFAKKFSQHLLNIYKKDKATKKFDDPDFIPKPIRLKPFILNSSSLPDTDFFQKAIETESNLQKAYQTNMTDLMKSMAIEQLRITKTALLDDLVLFTRNLVRAYDTVHPSVSGETLGSIDYIVYDTIQVSDTKSIESIDDNGITSTVEHVRKLMFQLLSNCNAGTELVKRINCTDLAADAQSFKHNHYAIQCSNYIKKILRSSIFAAHTAFQRALSDANKLLTIEGIYEEDLTQTAATAMEEEFDYAAGTAQSQVVNEATKTLIKEATKKLHNEISSELQELQVLKGRSRATTGGATSKKKSKKKTKTSSAPENGTGSKKTKKKAKKKNGATGKGKRKGKASGNGNSSNGDNRG